MDVALSLSAAFSMSSQNRTFTIVHTLRNPTTPALTVRGCSSSPDNTLRTFKNCKTQFDPLLNHPRACRFPTAHFGCLPSLEFVNGETKRKFERVYSGGTLNTPDSGKVCQYWHCCGSEDPFDLGCIAAPHSSFDD